MKKLSETSILLLPFFLVLMHAPAYRCSIQIPSPPAARSIHPYDYSATTMCLKEPLPAQYGGGIIVNPNLDRGTEGWTVAGGGFIEQRTSAEGNKFMVLHGRKYPWDGFSHKVQLNKGNHYVFSAWVQISEGTENVAVAFKIPSGGVVYGGTVVAKHGCWSMLKGGIVANFTSPAHIFFEANNTSIEVWVDNVSLQPFTRKQWRSHQLKSISKLRKRKLSLKISDANNSNIRVGGAKVIIKQTKPNFPFGCAMSKNIVGNAAYQNWFASSRFTVTTFRNEMKWYDNEPVQGRENYANPDAMLNFAKQHGISVRAHNIFWDDPSHQPSWVNGLNPRQLSDATTRRINSIMSKYKGRVISWDVVNENLHFKFFEDKLGPNFSGSSYAKAHQIDPSATLFMNEYNTVEDGRDPLSLPLNYINKLKDIQRNSGTRIGIGLQSHFNAGQPNIAYMRSALDTLGATGSPVWLTEVDIKQDPNQVKYLEQILMEGYSHPAVKGIVLWSGPAVDNYEAMTLTDGNYKSNAVGQLVNKLIGQWRTGPLELTTDTNGSLQVSLFHGDYDVTVIHPVTNSSTTMSITTDDALPAKNSHIHIHV